MEFLNFLAGLRNPVFDFIFSLITHLGEETFFLVFAILIFWCVDKRGGYYGSYRHRYESVAEAPFQDSPSLGA